jgi:hypothetical protein
MKRQHYLSQAGAWESNKSGIIMKQIMFFHTAKAVKQAPKTGKYFAANTTE